MSDTKSWNPWHGCRKYSEGCANCYMYMLDRLHKVPELSDMIARTKGFYRPLECNKKGQYKVPAGYMLRVNMTSDTFLEEADKWRDEMWSIIRSRPDVRFYLLTKRASRMAVGLPTDWGEGYENVMLNITCENQRTFDERWPFLRDIPAKHKGINLSPLIGRVDVEPAVASGQIEHIDLSGEGFGGSRRCHYEWVKQVSDLCARYRVNFAFDATGTFFVKDGRTYHIELQSTQSRQAFRSGLSHYFYRPEYKLYDPVDHHRLGPEELYTPMFNRYRCNECALAFACTGCQSCGKCQQVALVELEQLVSVDGKGL
ncbi:MAG: DUF5131 family protein [Bacteroidales bacterium]|nr:DUF5131 family protein [Bacteroidales bacterium]